jgi:hypothetical protein
LFRFITIHEMGHVGSFWARLLLLLERIHFRCLIYKTCFCFSL